MTEFSEKPLISLIMVTMNSASTIREALESIKTQIFRDFELIVIDGESDDETLSIIEASGIAKMVISEKDDGIYYAMNKGILLASGAYYGFLNSDDLFKNSHVLDKLATEMQKSGPDFLYGNLEYFSGSKANPIRSWRSGYVSHEDLRDGNFPPHPTFYTRRDSSNEPVLFDTRYRLAADAEYMTRCLLETGKTSVYVDEVLVSMRTGGATNSSIKNVLSQNFEIIEALKSHFHDFSFLRYLICKTFVKVKQFF